jgi:hypothetical protein
MSKRAEARELILFALGKALEIARKRLGEGSFTAPRAVEDLEYLQEVLALSRTWNGVPTVMFFTKPSPELLTFLKRNKAIRLKGFLALEIPPKEIELLLRSHGAEFPYALRKLSEYFGCSRHPG